MITGILCIKYVLVHHKCCPFGVWCVSTVRLEEKCKNTRNTCTVKPVLETTCIKRPTALTHSHTMTPFDAPGKQAF